MNTTLNGGKELTLTIGEESRTFFVKQVTIREMQRYLELQDDEIGIVAFCTNQTAEEVQALPLEVQEQLVEACEEVNADFFSRWLQRQQRRMERMAPGLLEKQMAALSALKTTAPKSPSPAG